MSRVRALTLLISIGLLIAASGAAQFATADLEGRVKDQNGDPLPGVTVIATKQDTGIARTVITGGSGAFSIQGLRPGRYNVTFELEGFKSLVQEGILLVVGQSVQLAVALELGAVEESINVTGVTPLIETSNKEIGGAITDEEFDVLPTANRSALLFASLLPGVVPDPSVESTAGDALFINGQDDNNNSFNIDGANNDDDVIGARAGAQTRTSMEAIQEFQVLTTQFDAEFGRTMGGVLNAVTKSGGNDFTGAAWWFRQSSGLAEPNYIVEQDGLVEPDTEYDNIGVNLGGPLVRNKAHFFLNFEDITQAEGQARSYLTRPDLNFSTSEDNEIENFLGKIDYTPVSSQQLSFRYLREHSPQFNQIIGSVTLAAAREEDDRDSNWILSLNSVIGNGGLNIARVSFTKEDVSFANPGFNNNGKSFEAQRNQPVSESHQSFTDGASTVAQSRFNRSHQFDDTFSFFVPEWNGDHEFRAGINYSEREEEFFNAGTAQGQFFGFQNDLPFDPNNIETYPGGFEFRALGALTAEIPQNDVLGLFVQDDWQITPNLTVNLGLRYDEEDITDDSNIAPRIGFAWDPSKSGRSVVRGGYGRFYDRFQLGFFANYFLDSINLPQGFLVDIPSSGLDKQLFFDLAQQNGIQTLDELRDLVISMAEGGAAAPINPSPTVDNPDRVQAYVDTVSIGYQREQWRGVAWSVDLIHSENRDNLVLVNLNPFSVSQGGRPNISILNGEQINLASISSWTNDGESDYDAIQLSLHKRFDGRWGGRVSMTFSDSEGNNEGLSSARLQTRTESGFNFDTGQWIGEPVNLNLDSPLAQDIPQRWQRDTNIVISGQYLIPGTSWRQSDGLIVAGVYRYLSGDYINIFDNSARFDNFNRALAAPGSYDANTDLGRGQSVNFNGKLRGAENPGFGALDLSFRYRIPLPERFSIELVGDVFNVTNTVNWSDRGGTRVGTGSFLVADSARPARRFQLGARFSF